MCSRDAAPRVLVHVTCLTRTLPGAPPPWKHTQALDEDHVELDHQRTGAVLYLHQQAHRVGGGPGRALAAAAAWRRQLQRRRQRRQAPGGPRAFGGPSMQSTGNAPMRLISPAGAPRP